MVKENRFTLSQIGSRVQKLKRGKHFVVKSESERKLALDAARYTGVVITTRRHKGGFVVLRLA